MKNTCRTCEKPVVGRSDKCFCSPGCKNFHHSERRKNSRDSVHEIDSLLHRNREILANLLGDNQKEMIDRQVLVKAGFEFDFMTNVYWNRALEMYRIVYDFAWMDFTDQRVVIVRKSEKTDLAANRIQVRA